MADIVPPPAPEFDIYRPVNRYGCLTYHDGTIKRRAIPAAERRAVAEREGCEPGAIRAAQCAYCGTPGQIVWHRLASGKPSAWVSFVDLHLDHVHPYSKGGASVAANLVLACQRCNSSKRDRVGDEWKGLAYP